MKSKLLHNVNELKTIVEDNHLHLKSKFLLVEASKIDDFPKLDENTIKTSITQCNVEPRLSYTWLLSTQTSKKLFGWAFK